MEYALTVFAGFVIIIAVVIGCVRYQRMLPSYRPFVWFTAISLLNLVISTTCSYLFKQNAVNANIYVLVEYLVILWLFYKWDGETHNRPNYYLSFAITGFIVWVFDNFFWHQLTVFNSLFRVVYSFAIVYLSVEHVNEMLFRNRLGLLKNARFIICLSFLIYYTYKAVIEVFFLFQVNMSSEFITDLFLILVFIDFLINLVYAWAMICIPTKQKFILPY